MHRHVVFTVVVFLCLHAISEAAPLVSLNDPTFGPGSITLDPNDNGGVMLEWLDWNNPAVLNMSPDQGLVAITGGALQGWRFATGDEVERLFVNAGILGAPIVATMEPPAVQAEINALVDILGDTDPLNNIYIGPTTIALLAPDSAIPGRAKFALLSTNWSGTGVDWAAANGQPGSDLNSASYPFVGLVLVREAQVPEPNAIILWFGMALVIGFGYCRYRK